MPQPDPIIEMAVNSAHEAQPELFAIAEAAVKRHGDLSDILSEKDGLKVATIMAEVQDQSFMLGVQVGMKLVMKLTGQEAPTPLTPS